MRLTAVLSCSEYNEDEDDDNLIGIQFMLGKSGADETFPLESFGDTTNSTGTCIKTVFDSSPHMFKVSGDSTGSGVNNLKLKWGYEKLVVGRTGKEDFQQWYFALTRPLIGLYGRQNAEGVDQLGVISFDTGCQKKLDTAAADAAKEAKRVAEATAQAEAEAELAKHAAPSVGTFIIVGVGILLFVILLILARWLSMRQAEKARVTHAREGDGDQRDKNPATDITVKKLYTSEDKKDIEKQGVIIESKNEDSKEEADAQVNKEMGKTE